MISKTLTVARPPDWKPVTTSQTVNFSYTNEGVPAGFSLPQVWTCGECQGVFQWSQIAGPGRTYQFDTVGRPSTMIDQSNAQWVRNVLWNPDGSLQQMQVAQGATWYTQTFGYNVRGQLIDQQATGPAAMHIQYEYPALNDGRIAKRTNAISGEEVNYTYDSLGRLATAYTTAEQGSNAWGIAFSYDGFGNLTAEGATPAPNVRPQVLSMNLNIIPATNRIQDSPYAYDNNGNLTSMPLRTMSYDIDNRLVQTVHTSNGTTNYIYNPWGQRVWMQAANGTETAYMYGVDGQLLATLGMATFNQYGNDDLHFWPATIDVRFAGRRLVNAPQMEDRLGTVGSYYPYGEARGGGGSHFATYTRDSASGLDYAMNRYYSSQVARFLTPDPWGGSANLAAPQSWNRYAYVEGDPANANDPSGLGGYFSFTLTRPAHVGPVVFPPVPNAWTSGGPKQECYLQIQMQAGVGGHGGFGFVDAYGWSMAMNACGMLPDVFPTGGGSISSQTVGEGKNAARAALKKEPCFNLIFGNSKWKTVQAAQKELDIRTVELEDLGAHHIL
jgi:RHS repeat-associated protein